jgi:hypothetical protein
MKRVTTRKFISCSLGLCRESNFFISGKRKSRSVPEMTNIASPEAFDSLTMLKINKRER